MRYLMRRQCYAFACLCLFIFSVGKAWHWAKDSFSIRRIQQVLPEENTPLLCDDIPQEALQQPYYYLSRGHQCYAFVSADQKYVLKLPRFDRYQQPFWVRSCTCSWLTPYRNKYIAEKNQRWNFIKTSFAIAAQELQKETSLLAMHLQKTDNLHQTLSITDRIGCSYTLNLDDTGFILQKKEDLLVPCFLESLRVNNREQARHILQAFLEATKKRALLGIVNKDPSFVRNFGWNGTQCVQIDIGSFYRDPTLDPLYCFTKTVGHVKEWLPTIDTEMEQWFDAQATSIIQQDFIAS